MFNVKHPSTGGPDLWIERLRRWSGLELDDDAVARLEQYAAWLSTEALAAGGIGPDEASRLWPRHLADSLSYAAVFVGRQGSALDIGSGVGLPGIPLAIACPHLDMTLVDRSGRRTALLRRVVRILNLSTTRVVEADVDAIDGNHDVIVARASLPPEQLFPRIRRLLATTGEAVMGLSRQTPPDAAGLDTAAAGHGLQTEVVSIPPEVLDSPAWLLRMTHRE